MPFYVLKLGGSLIDSSQDLMRALVFLADDEDYSFLVVPGGGPFADLVREVFEKENLSQEAAHWMAVLAMEQYAYFLADGTGARLTSQISRSGGAPYKNADLNAKLNSDGNQIKSSKSNTSSNENLNQKADPKADPKVWVLLPYQFLQKEDICPEHSWDYTSDSIALLVAAKLGSPLVKATDVDGVIVEGKVRERLSARELLGMRCCIDQGSLRQLCRDLSGMTVWILNGTNPDEFITALKSGKGGTFINGGKPSVSC